MNGAMLCVFLGIWLLSVTENFNHPLLPMAVLISVVECAIAQVHQGLCPLANGKCRPSPFVPTDKRFAFKPCACEHSYYLLV